MSAWQLVNAFSGLSADFVSGRLAFAPKLEGNYRLFWSAGTSYGTLSRSGGKVSLSVVGGTLRVSEIAVDTIVHRGAVTLSAGQTLALGAAA